MYDGQNHLQSMLLNNRPMLQGSASTKAAILDRSLLLQNQPGLSQRCAELRESGLQFRRRLFRRAGATKECEIKQPASAKVVVKSYPFSSTFCQTIILLHDPTAGTPWNFARTNRAVTNRSYTTLFAVAVDRDELRTAPLPAAVASGVSTTASTSWACAADR